MICASCGGEIAPRSMVECVSPADGSPDRWYHADCTATPVRDGGHWNPDGGGGLTDQERLQKAARDRAFRAAGGAD